jgi:hypothetical protein
MGTDHDRLEALRRLAKDRAATPAEKATARRFAETLAAKIGKRPRRSRHNTQGAALPEPAAARWRRLCIIWLEAVLDSLAVVGGWVHVIWIASLVGFVLMFSFGSDAVRRQANDIYFVRTLGLMAAVLVMMSIGGLLAFAAWWLKTWRADRLRPALVSLAKGPPLFATMCLVAYLDHRFIKPSLPSLSVAQAIISVSAILAVTTAAIITICVPWWRWVQPVIERAVLRASRGALRAGVAVAIAVILSAGGGVWARWAYAHHAHARVLTAPLEFEVPVPFPYTAVITMIDYRLAAIECLLARHYIERDVTASAPSTSVGPARGWSGVVGSWTTSRWPLRVSGQISLPMRRVCRPRCAPPRSAPTAAPAGSSAKKSR